MAWSDSFYFNDKPEKEKKSNDTQTQDKKKENKKENKREMAS